MDGKARTGRVKVARLARSAMLPVAFLLVLGGCREVKPVEPLSGNLQAIAETALGDREGAVIIADPATGRILAVVNPRLAFEQSFPPGSSIKPFSALAALASRRISLDHTHLCRGGMRDEHGNLLCSHPRIDHPLRLDEALAWSCNDFFMALGERLSRPVFNDYLRQYGFGAPTGIGAREESGHLAAAGDGIRAAIGEGSDLLVTPLQLLRGYLALVNGGMLCRPQIGAEFVDRCAEPIQRVILDAHRRVIVKGMIGAVEYGTAARAGLLEGDDNDGGVLIHFGKTGTAAASNGFRRHGWFIGFKARRGYREENGVPSPSALDLAVLVFLRRGTGAEAAEVAATILAKPSTGAAAVKASEPTLMPQIRVRLSGKAREAGEDEKGVVRTLTLEEYVAGALRAENGLERQRAALEAQAIVIRTFALHNTGRHEHEGFDLCSTTHCQRFQLDRARAASAAGRAAAATAGLVLRDPAGGIAEVYYHAACGGETSSIASVWRGATAPAWLRGVVDPFCASPNADRASPQRSWEDRLTRQQIEQALRADRTTRTVGRLRQLVPTAIDRAGRVGLINLEGERRLQISAWDFKLIIGRALGWQVLKSTLFEMVREGDLYIFRGRGFGHGIGLCQDGAHHLARRGLNFRQILDHYFPGTVITRDTAEWNAAARPGLIAVSLDDSSSQGRTIHDGLIRWVLPERTTAEPSVNSRIGIARELIGEARRDLEARTGRQISQPIEVHLHESTANFIAATGLPGWASGATRAGRIDLQPLDLLDRRGILKTSLRHEFVHAALAQFNSQCPRWISEGLAIHFAGEGPAYDRLISSGRLTLPELPETRTLEERLNQRHSQLESRRLYAAVWRRLQRQLAALGEAAVWRVALEATPSRLL